MVCSQILSPLCLRLATPVRSLGGRGGRACGWDGLATGLVAGGYGHADDDSGDAVGPRSLRCPGSAGNVCPHVSPDAGLGRPVLAGRGGLWNLQVEASAGGSFACAGRADRVSGRKGVAH